MKCECGLSFPRTRNGYFRWKDHLDGPAGIYCEGKGLWLLSADITEMAMDLFSAHWGDDLPVPNIVRSASRPK